MDELFAALQTAANDYNSYVSHETVSAFFLTHLRGYKVEMEALKKQKEEERIEETAKKLKADGVNLPTQCICVFPLGVEVTHFCS